MKKRLILATTAVSLLLSHQVFAQSPAGASAASQKAFGGLSQQEAVVGAFGVAFLAAVVSGNSGSTTAVVTGAPSASAAATEATSAASAASTVISSLNAAVRALGSVSVASTELLALYQAVSTAEALQIDAAAAASDLTAANAVPVVGVVNAGRTICAAANSCTKAELAALSFRAADTAKKAAEAALFAVARARDYEAALIKAGVTPSQAFSIALNAASEAALKAQAAANSAIDNYTKALAALGATGTTISPSTGTTGATGTR